MNTLLPIPDHRRALTAAEFQRLTAVPAELEWLANLANDRTRRAYRRDVTDFSRFVGIQAPEEFRQVTRAHVLAWRRTIEDSRAAPATIRRKLAALSSLFDYLCDRNAVTHNPVQGVKRPPANNNEGATPALSAAQARQLLDAPATDTLKGKRDRAILATLLYHGLRREELCRLSVGDLHLRSGIMHLRVQGKGSKLRYVPVAPVAQHLIRAYLDVAGHAGDRQGPLFRPVRNHVTHTLAKPLHPESVYRSIVRYYGDKLGITDLMHGFCVHSLRATAATNALEHAADIAEVQHWLGHANIATTRLYDKRRQCSEDSPTFKVRF